MTSMGILVLLFQFGFGQTGDVKDQREEENEADIFVTWVLT